MRRNKVAHLKREEGRPQGSPGTSGEVSLLAVIHVRVTWPATFTVANPAGPPPPCAWNGTCLATLLAACCPTDGSVSRNADCAAAEDQDPVGADERYDSTHYWRREPCPTDSGASLR